MELSAVFFDVDGTIAETENFHRKAFNDAFKEFNLDWFWDEPIYKELINIGGGKERIMYHIKRAWPEMLTYKNLSKTVDFDNFYNLSIIEYKKKLENYNKSKNYPDIDK